MKKIREINTSINKIAIHEFNTILLFNKDKKIITDFIRDLEKKAGFYIQQHLEFNYQEYEEYRNFINNYEDDISEIAKKENKSLTLYLYRELDDLLKYVTNIEIENVIDNLVHIMSHDNVLDTDYDIDYMCEYYENELFDDDTILNCYQ